MYYTYTVIGDFNLLVVCLAFLYEKYLDVWSY